MVVQIINTGRQAQKHLQPEVFMVLQIVCVSLADAYFVIETLDKAQGDLVFGLAVSGEAVPVLLDYDGELLVRLQALPLPAHLPIGSVSVTGKTTFPHRNTETVREPLLDFNGCPDVELRNYLLNLIHET